MVKMAAAEAQGRGEDDVDRDVMDESRRRRDAGRGDEDEVVSDNQFCFRDEKNHT